MRHYLFVAVPKNENTPETGIGSDTLFADFDAAFDRLRSYALTTFDLDDLECPRPGTYCLNVKGTRLEIWAVNIPNAN